MRRWMFAASATLIMAAWWHLPAVAQRAAQPAAGEAITFEQYRDFRLHDVAQRQARLAQQLAASGLSAAETASLERRKAYYDQRAAWREKQRENYRQQAAARARPAGEQR